MKADGAEGERNSSTGLSLRAFYRHGTFYRYMQDAHFIDERVSQRAFSSLSLSLVDPLVPMHATDLSTCPRIIRAASFHRATTPLLRSFCLHGARFRHRGAYAPRLSPRQRTRGGEGSPFDPLLRAQTLRDQRNAPRL